MEENILLLREMQYNCINQSEYIDPKAVQKAQAIEKILDELKDLQKENEKLKSDNLEKARILEIFDYRKYRKKYLEERRKEEPNLLYPDSDEIYKRYYEQKKQIDLMAEYINNIQDCPLENCGVDLDCENRCNNDEELIKQCWKMYFESKSKEK